MIIRSLSGTFGRLGGEELRLKEGLNILTAPNESGKSTWCALLRCMLYGVDSARRPRAGELPDKTRYLPWSGEVMEGRMDVVWRGRELSLTRRTALPALPMREFTAVDNRTGELITALHAGDAGEQLCGCGETVFTRTALIRGPVLRVDNDGELEGMIASILAAPSGDLSYPETDTLLREWQRKLSYRGRGRLPELEEELAALEDTLKKRTDTEREAEALAQALEEAGALLEEKRALIRQSTGEELSALRKNAAALEQKAAALERKAEEQRETLSQSPLAKKNGVTRAEAVLQDTEALARRGMNWQLLIPGGLFGILALAALWWNTAAALCLFAVSAVLFTLVWAGERKRRNRRSRARKLLAPYGVSSAEELSTLIWDFKTAVKRCRRELESAEAARVEADAAAESLRALEEAALAAAAEGTAAEEQRFRELRSELDRVRGRLDTFPAGEELLTRQQALYAEQEEKTRRFEALSAAQEVMAEANSALRSHYAPELSRLTGEYFSRLTGGRYSEVLLQQDLNALLLPAGSALRRERGYLSRGAGDQLALALRLALCTLLLSGEEKCPIILDDALTAFDDERLGFALELLEELGRERQILLFTCTDREERWLRSRGQS